MLEIDCLTFKDCCVDSNSNKSYKLIKEDKEDKEDNEINVIFFYNETDKRVDKNIHQIIFYQEYLQGYYTSNFIHKVMSNKNILVIYNKNVSCITNIINNIHNNKGLSINNQKWVPKHIWIFN